MATSHYNTLTFVDKTGEPSTMTVFNDAITAVSLPGYLANLTDFRAKTNAITLGDNKRNTWVGDADDNAVDLAAQSNYSQRENKLLVTYKDTTTNEEYTLTIPTIDLSKLAFIPGAKDAVPLDASAEIIAWITSFETLASPPEAPGNAVEVLKLRFVGRNS
jgi:hypothetical protein